MLERSECMRDEMEVVAMSEICQGLGNYGKDLDFIQNEIGNFEKER